MKEHRPQRQLRHANHVDVSSDIFVGPGGFATPDDFEAFALCQRPARFLYSSRTTVSFPESMIILDYLEHRFPSPSLRLGDAALHARTRAAVQIHDLYVKPEFNPVFAQFAQPTVDDAAIDRIFASITQRLPLILSTLPPASSYAAGSELSLADCTMAPFFVLYRSVAANLYRQNPIETQPRLAQWSAALLQHPGGEIDAGSIRQVPAAVRTNRCVNQRIVADGPDGRLTNYEGVRCRSVTPSRLRKPS